jgi:hypothetical protein
LKTGGGRGENLAYLWSQRGRKAYSTYYGKLSVVGRLKMVSLEEFLRAKIFFG